MSLSNQVLYNGFDHGGSVDGLSYVFTYSKLHLKSV